MSLFKIALPALAVAGSAYGTTSATATIENSGDATAIAGCKTYTGSIAIATGVGSDLSLDGQLQSIDGDLILENNKDIVRFSAGSLKNITGELRVSNVPEIASLSMPQLTSVDTLTLNGLANLRNLEFTSVISKCDHLDIQNTVLLNLNGIGLNEAADILIANNKAIDTINFMNITNITERLELSYNNLQVNVSFPILESANNISLRAIGSLDIPALSKINVGDFGVFESDNLTSISAPNLTQIDGALVIANNKGLQNISFDALTKVDANLQIANNTNLHELQGLPKLKNVGAALDISGNFSKVETPSLELVKGVFNLQSTGNIGDVCSKFYDPLRDSNKLPKGKYVCLGELDKANTAGTQPSGSSSGSGNKPGAAVGLSVPSISLGLVGLFAILLL
ncbi:hypothetical protein BU23DRAFT_465642 [Bimuria novae-zelandiae CBS 107.79]|uniref:GPI-anchored cell wall organization protein Ecm33 n=1 Tax=Bimuria novae-zelandiae CBS 107.79 TaxID=1447943 RepID=A0A6A5V6Q4_9PLEO|nr:hypothetical protein BU23DRAFT_465642 [Bimuria novae-zelandiae CBS 107.79]